MALRAVVRSFGPAHRVVEVEEYTPPPPGPGQVALRMTAAAVNPSDVVTIAGAYPSRTRLPLVPGYEGVGVVERVGPDVADIAPGARVLPLGSAGAWQQVRTVEARWCFPVLPELDDEQAASAYVNPLTAVLMVRGYGVPGARAVVDAAGSAIGRMLLRLLSESGCAPVAVVRSAAGRARLAGLVDDSEVVCTEEQELAPAIEARTGGRGPAVVFDAVGGEQGAALARGLAHGGTFVHYGLLSGAPLPDPSRYRPDVRLVLFRLRHVVHRAERPWLERSLAEAQELTLDGETASPVAARYPLAEARTALEHEAAAGRAGKVLLLPQA